MPDDLVTFTLEQVYADKIIRVKVNFAGIHDYIYHLREGDTVHIRPENWYFDDEHSAKHGASSD